MWISSCARLTNTCLKLTIKIIRLIYMCSSFKINTACHRPFVFIVDFKHIVFFSRMWNEVTMFSNPISRPISFSNLWLHPIEINHDHIKFLLWYEHIMILWTYVPALNFLWESQANNYRLAPLFDLLYHCYFPEIYSNLFLLYQNENLF